MLLLCSPSASGVGPESGVPFESLAAAPDFPEVSVDELLGSLAEDSDTPPDPFDPDGLVGDNDEAWDDFFLDEDDAADAGEGDGWDSDEFDFFRHEGPSSPGGDGASAKPGSVQWWKEKADTPVSQTGDWASATVIQVAVSLTEAALQHNVRDSAFDEIIKLFKHQCLQPGSLFPPSKYIMVKLLEPASLESSMYHLCIGCGDHVWEPLPRSRWKGYFHDVCPNEGCEGRRFKASSEGCAEIEPSKVHTPEDETKYNMARTSRPLQT